MKAIRPTPFAAPRAACGVDLVDVAAFERVVDARGSFFLDRVFAPREREEAADVPQRLAARFAAKEAATKVLGTGLYGVDLREIVIVSEPSGRPTLRLLGAARTAANQRGISSLSLSLAHTDQTAAAVVVCLVERPEEDAAWT